MMTFQPFYDSKKLIETKLIHENKHGCTLERYELPNKQQKHEGNDVLTRFLVCSEVIPNFWGDIYTAAYHRV